MTMTMDHEERLVAALEALVAAETRRNELIEIEHEARKESWEQNRADQAALIAALLQDR